MANIKLQEKLTAVADAIRAKTGKSEKMTLAEMPVEIGNIQSGGGGSTARGYEVDDVTFYDYDGTIVYSCSIADAQNLTELPTPPKHKGLVFQEWNWTLEEIKSSSVGADVGANYDTTDGSIQFDIFIENKIELDVNIVVKQKKTGNTWNAATIDWGDGTVEKCPAQESPTMKHSYAKCGRYTIVLRKGDGMTGIILEANYSSALFSTTSTVNRNIIEKVRIGSDCYSLGAYAFYGTNRLKSVAISNNVLMKGLGVYSVLEKSSLSFFVITRVNKYFESNIFNECRRLTGMSIPPTVTTIPQYFARKCISMQRVILPDSITGFSANYSSFSEASALVDLRIGNKLKTLSGSVFSNAVSLAHVVIPDGVTTIEDGVFSGCTNMREYVLKPTTPPTLASAGSLAINTFGSEKTKIYVPKGTADAYKSATNWAVLANYIVEEE